MIAHVKADVKLSETKVTKDYYVNAENNKHALKLVSAKIKVDFPKYIEYNAQIVT